MDAAGAGDSGTRAAAADPTLGAVQSNTKEDLLGDVSLLDGDHQGETQQQAMDDSDAQAADAVPDTTPVLHTYAQQGDVNSIRDYLTNKHGDVNEADQEGITALHWAAMNMHVMACRELLDRGAEVDAQGGQLHATPLHWAARNGNLYVVHLLILHGADPALTDQQGFNTLHLAVHSHNPMLLAYLLSQQLPITVDSEDPQGQTPLQWACYQGDQLSVSLLLKAGADPNKSSQAGLTSVHWAVVKGSVGCIARVVEGGGDALKKDHSDMTPLDLARKQRSIQAWIKAMDSVGRDVDGKPKKSRLSDSQTKVAIFLTPFIGAFLILKTLEILPWHTGLLLSGAEAFGMNHVVTKVLLEGKPNLAGTKPGDALQKSPYLMAVLASSIFWVAQDWLTVIVSNTTSFAYTNLLFAASALLSAYNLFRAVTLDPGYVVKPTSDIEVREAVDDLTTQGKMNGQNFCLQCFVRQPLRSRHCRHCNRCVARFDHHCPWIYNCVGLRNHRQFVCFILFLITGILTFDYLVYQYLSENTPAYDTAIMSSTCLFPSPICAASSFATRTFVIALWSTLQITWTSIVSASHLYQMSKNITTFELSNLGRYGHMGTRGLSASAQEGFMASHAHSHSHTAPGGETEGSQAAAGGAGHVHGPACKHGHHSRNPLKICAALVGRVVPNTLLAIVGLDLYTKGRGAEGIAKAAKPGNGGNPFDVGMMKNCTDFWTTGRTLGVDYERLWDIPPEGYRAVIAARKRQLVSQKEAQSMVRRRSGTGGGASGGGYEMLRTSIEEV